MKIAVTGAAGFLGSHVLANLANRNIDIVAVGREGDTPPSLDYSNLRYMEMDLYECGDDIFDRLGQPDALIHLAWGGLPNYKSLHHIEKELPQQFQFLKKVVKGGLSNLVVTGTCFEYGMKSGPLSEDMLPEPNNCYGFAKNTLFRQLEFLQKEHAFNMTWARLFYLYGEGQAPSSLYTLLKNAVQNGDKVFNMSAGEQLRDYLPVAELINILTTLAVEKANIGVVNVCSGVPTSIRALVEKWMSENGWEIELNLGHYGYPDYEPMAFWGDRTKLNRFLQTV